MKTILLVLSVMSIQASVATAGMDEQKVVSGRCQLESTREIMIIENVDPLQFYGVFAKGHLNGTASLQLVQFSGQEIHARLSTPTQMAGTTVELDEAGNARVRISLHLRDEDPKKSGWVSCDLKIARSEK
ncbi:MAG: hypothetical protein EOP09_15420 [Proteobacteria bacterium]|nr:MAG: hypothetical protein EOP09_15420 [Pseudomonadota bacterium]